MMKAIKLYALAMVAVVVMMACGGQQAHAQMSNLYSAPIAYGAGQVKSLTAQDFVTVADANQLSQFRAMPGFSEYIQLGSTPTWLNTTKILQVVAYNCNGSNGSLAVYWYDTTSTGFPDPGCVTFAALLAKAVKLSN